ncbi:hypothetical protein HK104_008586 [Borealophlyctis nickersoniae]|nr:hypothetical protein HK104_008586 [Borealophlyctis nickersoniae]
MSNKTNEVDANTLAPHVQDFPSPSEIAERFLQEFHESANVLADYLRRHNYCISFRRKMPDPEFQSCEMALLAQMLRAQLVEHGWVVERVEVAEMKEACGRPVLAYRLSYTIEVKFPIEALVSHVKNAVPKKETT